jgi:hypothetical protein
LGFPFTVSAAVFGAGKADGKVVAIAVVAFAISLSACSSQPIQDARFVAALTIDGIPGDRTEEIGLGHQTCDVFTNLIEHRNDNDPPLARLFMTGAELKAIEDRLSKQGLSQDQQGKFLEEVGNIYCSRLRSEFNDARSQMSATSATETPTETTTAEAPTTTETPTTTVAPPSFRDDQTTAYDELRRYSEVDRPNINHNTWVPQLSSKHAAAPWTYDKEDGVTYDSVETLREHQELRRQYGAILLWSGDWSGYTERNDWVTVAPIGYPDSADALAWCTSHGLDSDHCYAEDLFTGQVAYH